jgi:signal transduction histidine kinase
MDEADKDRQRGLLKKVLEQVDKAGNIVRDLLEFSRSREFLKETFNLKDMLDRTLSLCRGQIPSGVQVSTKINANLTLLADKHRMQQAFMNLITNAVQAVGDEGEVKITAYDNRDGMVTIVIRDTGRGIPEEALPRIFDPFFTTKDVGQGTGLGLFITHDIVVRHGGTIKVKSYPDKGTGFIIKMPAEESRK